MNYIKKTLSLGIPIYYKEPTTSLMECFDSVLLNIAYVDELILVQEGINIEIVKNIDNFIGRVTILNDKCIVKFVCNIIPQGLALALNAMLERCTCDYFRRLDADDILINDALKLQLKFMEEFSLDISGTNALLIVNGRHTDRQYMKRNYKKLPLYTLWTTPVIHPTVMFRMDFVNQHSLAYDTQDEQLRQVMVEDWRLWNEFRLLNANFGVLQLPLLYYRIKDVSRQYDRFKRGIDIKSRYINEISKNKLEKLILKMVLLFFRMSSSVFRKMYHSKYN